MASYEPKVGDTVRAFHPRMMGVVKVGQVLSVGPKYVMVHFGPLLGRELVTREHVLGEGEAC